jgi:hypothetical protein
MIDDLAVNNHPHVEQRNWQPGDDPGGGETRARSPQKALFAH